MESGYSQDFSGLKQEYQEKIDEKIQATVLLEKDTEELSLKISEIKNKIDGHEILLRQSLKGVQKQNVDCYNLFNKLKEDKEKGLEQKHAEFSEQLAQEKKRWHEIKPMISQINKRIK